MATKTVKKAKVAQGHHFYASTPFAWGTGTTRDAAIREALAQTGSAFDKVAGIYIWSARVELPGTAAYKIELYMPVDVPLSEKDAGYYTLKGRTRDVVRLRDAK